MCGPCGSRGWSEADRLLEDEELIDRVYEAQGERHEHSATRGPFADAGRDGVAAAVAEASCGTGVSTRWSGRCG